MIDLTSIVNYERDFPLDLVHPATVGSDKPKKIGVTFMVRHIDCAAATEVARKRNAAALLQDADDADEADVYAACITGWEGEISMGDGKALKYSPENARKVLRHPSCKWIFAQVRRATLKIGNFTDA